MSAVLNATLRESNLSRGELNKLKKAGKIPSCIFGKGMETIQTFVNALEFEKIYKAEGKIFETELNGEKYLTNAKEIQTHAFANSIIHIGFHKLTRGETTTINVPVEIIGTAPGVKAGGVLNSLLDTVQIDAFPTNIPSSIQIDISTLELGATLSLSQVTLPTGAVFNDSVDMEAVVVTCVAAQLQEEEAAPEAAAEAAAEGESAEAAAPADEAPKS